MSHFIGFRDFATLKWHMAKDIIHDAVKNALINGGWKITADQYKIQYLDSKVFADLAAELPIAADLGERKIAVEIKSFLGPLRCELESAIGQYRIYRAPSFGLQSEVRSRGC